MSAQMAEGPTEESHPWGFPHEPEAPKVTQTFYDRVKEWFRADGRLMRAVEGIEELLPKLRMLSERGPQDYEGNERELKQLIFEAVRVGAQNGGNYGGVSGGQDNWKTIALFVMGILQIIILGFLSYMHTTMTQTHDDVNIIKCKLDPQCRIVVSSDKP